MSRWDEISFAPQGWQCPICGAVYSPMTMQCFNCTGWKTSNASTTTEIYKKYINESDQTDDYKNIRQK